MIDAGHQTSDIRYRTPETSSEFLFCPMLCIALDRRKLEF